MTTHRLMNDFNCFWYFLFMIMFFVIFTTMPFLIFFTSLCFSYPMLLSLVLACPAAADALSLASCAFWASSPPSHKR